MNTLELPKRPAWKVALRVSLIVIAVVIGLGIGVPFLLSLVHPNWHLHSSVRKTPSGLYQIIPQTTQEPFLTRFFRRVLNRNPGEKRHCGVIFEGHEEVCALENPEIQTVGFDSRIAPPMEIQRQFKALPRQLEAEARLNAEEDRKKAGGVNAKE